MAFNRNIITKEDASNFDLARRRAGPMPATLETDPPAPAPGNSSTQGDDFLTQLVKFIPIEILGLYTLVASIVAANAASDGVRGWWLFGLFIGSVVLAPLYTWRVGKVIRPGQNVASAVAMAVYVFAVGGWFTTLSWYQQWYGAIAVSVAVVLLALFNLKPLTVPAAPVLEAVDQPAEDDKAA